MLERMIRTGKDRQQTQDNLVNQTISPESEKNISTRIKELMASALYIREGALGLNGEPFDMPKFRTMVKNAHKMHTDLVLRNGVDKDGYVINDPRIIPYIGPILRATHLDELPQLYNFFRGDMILCGIRPRNEVDWVPYPAELKEKALKTKPGLFPATYAFENLQSFNDKIAAENQFLDDYLTNPRNTEITYFMKGLFNISKKPIPNTPKWFL